MSKKNRYKFKSQSSISAGGEKTQNRSSDVSVQHAEEYGIIRKDLIRLAVLNLLMLGAVIALFYTNKSSGYLERIFEKLF